MTVGNSREPVRSLGEKRAIRVSLYRYVDVKCVAVQRRRREKDFYKNSRSSGDRAKIQSVVSSRRFSVKATSNSEYMSRTET